MATPVCVPIGGEHDGDDGGKLLPMVGEGAPERPTMQIFQSLVGSLLWIARCTRPDISFAVHRVTRRAHAPREEDWQLAKKILWCLKATMHYKFIMRGEKSLMGKCGVQVEAYSDADFAAEKIDRKSVSGG
ncbi:Retroelement [Phytophthora megakarya]|uniref:Retroelement n=1 Tax=Phytophthora megakarya TaxID=4795 RepID=A0A225WTC5_9STRA|nr:Retroelement [Phytophthora megakarya]